ncbi:MAG: DnaJ domain-containing protein [Thermodesulfobacteriota bacterium]
MKYLIYLLLILYALSPVDLIPEWIAGHFGLIDDVIVIGVIYWYFIHRPAKMKAQRAQYQKTSSSQRQERKEEGFKNNHQGSQTGKGFAKRDPYEVLGLSRGASLDEVKNAYRQLANKYHPDKVNHLGEEFKQLAEKRFKEIQEAYQELAGK